MNKSFTVGLGLAILLGVATMVRADKSEVEWRTIVQALDEAPKQNKKIILDVYTDWCGWCKRMDRDTYSDTSITSYMSNHFVASRMNPEKEGSVEFSGKKYSQREFGQALGVNGYPATAIFNEKGELLTMIPGYMAPKEFMKVLRYFGENAYLSTKWEDYARK